MKIKYTLSTYSRETRKTCDEAASAFQDCFIEVAKVVSKDNRFITAFAWFITRFRTVSLIEKEEKFELTYNFYLIK